MKTKRTRGSRTASTKDAIVRAFPPLPRRPLAPRSPPDPRQARARRVVGAIADGLDLKSAATGTGDARGFAASAVDLGRLQLALGPVLARLDATQTEARWPEVLEWIRGVLVAWVQRIKRMKIVRFANGVRIELQTQDDLGYYDYGFDVMRPV